MFGAVQNLLALIGIRFEIIQLTGSLFSALDILQVFSADAANIVVFEIKFIYPLGPVSAHKSGVASSESFRVTRIRNAEIAEDRRSRSYEENIGSGVCPGLICPGRFQINGMCSEVSYMFMGTVLLRFPQMPCCPQVWP